MSEETGELITVYEPTLLLCVSVKFLNEMGIPRVKMLPDQTIKTLNGVVEDIDPNIPVQTQTSLRAKNPIGTIFEVHILEKRKNSKGHIYYTNAGYSQLAVKK